ncbi:MAG: glycosyltransferase family 9 protein, partial [Steroidobacteraceae bacterium]|nr:glycosyltransferase family 9 protein [Steroidobacteraceae bacterium]
AALRRELRGREFDVLLHLQLALRASLVAAQIPARVKLGFDRARARELHWLFTDAQIAPREREHVLDSFLGFAHALGVPAGPPRWDVPLPREARAYAERLAAAAAPRGLLIISACSSHPRRNWLPERYAAVATHAIRRHGLQVILTGGPGAHERTMADQIIAACSEPLVDTVGRDTLPELLALLERATALVTPDSGPAHMATMVGTPVIGLYAATNPERSGPYLSRQWCVNAYDRAARRYRGKPAAALPWTEKIEEPGVMALIEVDEVTAKLDELLASGAATRPRPAPTED